MNSPAYILNQIKTSSSNNHIAHDAECKCCGEDVGEEDARAIDEQLENREKNCMWCGNDFDLTEDEYVRILDNDEIDFESTLDSLNRDSRTTLNGIRDKIVDTDDFDFLIGREPEPKEKTKEWISARKEAILRAFGIDVEKEKFEPGYADSKGNPRDRMADGVAYEQADVNQLIHRILKFVKSKPGCNMSELVRQSRYSNPVKYRRINDSPTARMVAAGLLEYTSDFCGLYKHNNHNHASIYFGQIPRFKRKFTLTKKGKGVLKEFEKGKTRVLL